MNFTEAEEYLNSRTMFGIKLGLENIQLILSKLDNPENSLKFIHIAGTNGKGSTSCLLNAALINNNQNVGMFTSPHLISVRERIRINGEAISENDFCNALEKVIAASKLLDGIEPTYFECTSLIAIMAFVEAKCDYVIWECGMGGRLDATNVVTPLISIITNCALDHTEYLGSTIEEITAEKGGIIKPSIPIFYGGEDTKVRNILAFMAKAVGASFLFRGNDFYLQNYDFSDDAMFTRVGFQHGEPITAKTLLWGYHQATNITLVIGVIRYLCLKFPSLNLEKSIDGLALAIWPGRLQELSWNKNKILIDGAHNSHAAKALTTSLLQRWPDRLWHVTIGILKDKDVKEFITEINKIASSFTILPVTSERAISVDAIKQIIHEVAPNKAINTLTLDEFVAHSHPEHTLLTGSLYLLGEIIEKINSNLPAVLVK